MCVCDSSLTHVPMCVYSLLEYTYMPLEQREKINTIERKANTLFSFHCIDMRYFST